MPSLGKRAAAEALFDAAGIPSPWPKDKVRTVQPAQPALFDLVTFEPLVWGPLATAVIEDLADAAMCAYSVEEDRGYEVVLRSKYFSGGELVTWRVVRWASRSYALRLPDGRLLEFVQGSSRPLCADTQSRRDAREQSKGKSEFWGIAS